MVNIFGYYCFEPWELWLIVAGCALGGLLVGLVLRGSRDYAKVSERKDRLCEKCGSYIFKDETRCSQCGVEYVDEIEPLNEADKEEISKIREEHINRIFGKKQ